MEVNQVPIYILMIKIKELGKKSASFVYIDYKSFATL